MWSRDRWKKRPQSQLKTWRLYDKLIRSREQRQQLRQLLEDRIYIPRRNLEQKWWRQSTKGRDVEPGSLQTMQQRNGTGEGVAKCHFQVTDPHQNARGWCVRICFRSLTPMTSSWNKHKGGNGHNRISGYPHPQMLRYGRQHSESYLCDLHSQIACALP